LVKVVIPAIWFPTIQINRGLLLNASLFGLSLVIPPVDIKLTDAFQLSQDIVLFDTDDIGRVVGDAVVGIPQAIFGVITPWLEAQVEQYYKDHPERK